MTLMAVLVILEQNIVHHAKAKLLCFENLRKLQLSRLEKSQVSKG